MNTNTNIKGLKKAIGMYKELNKGAYSPHYGILCYDKETGEVWTKEFYDYGHGSYSIFSNGNIVNISKEMADREIPVNMRNVKKFITENY